MLGGESQQAGVLVDGLVPFDAPAPEGPGLVVDTPGDLDAESVGAAPAFSAGDDLQVIDVLHDPDELLRLHQVERVPAGDDVLGNDSDDSSLVQILHLCLYECHLLNHPLIGYTKVCSQVT